MDQNYDEFFENAQKAISKGKLMKLPRFHRNLKYNFDGRYNYRTTSTLTLINGRENSSKLPAQPGKGAIEC